MPDEFVSAPLRECETRGDIQYLLLSTNMQSGAVQAREWLPMAYSFYHQIQLLNIAQTTRHSHGKQKRKRPHRSPKLSVRHRQRHETIEHAELPPLDVLRLENSVQNSEAVKLREISDGGLSDLPILPLPELQEETYATRSKPSCKSGNNSFVDCTPLPVVVMEERAPAEGTAGLSAAFHGGQAFSAHGVIAGQPQWFLVRRPAHEACGRIFEDDFGGSAISDAICVLLRSHLREGAEAGQVQVVERATW
jgi:hypothetical protein